MKVTHRYAIVKHLQATSNTCIYRMIWEEPQSVLAQTVTSHLKYVYWCHLDDPHRDITGVVVEGKVIISRVTDYLNFCLKPELNINTGTVLC